MPVSQDTNNPGSTWSVLLSDQRQFGPITQSELDLLIAQNAVSATTLLARDGDNVWMEASQLYPALASSSESTHSISTAVEESGNCGVCSHDEQHAMLSAIAAHKECPRRRPRAGAALAGPNQYAVWGMALVVGLAAAAVAAQFGGRQQQLAQIVRGVSIAAAMAITAYLTRRSAWKKR